MSAKPSVLFSVSKEPVVQEQGGDNLYTSFLLPDTSPEIFFSLRAFNPVADLPVLYDWLHLEYPGALSAANPSLNGLATAYAAMLESNSIRPFMGFLNGVPVCQIDFYKAGEHAISSYYKSSGGDFGLQWRVGPSVTREQMAILLRTCLEYFFSFPEVGRILSDVDAEDAWSNEVFRNAGFVFCQRIAIPYRTSNLYACMRGQQRKG